MTSKKLVIILLSLFCISWSGAAIDVVAYYKLGEDDPSAAAGNTGNDPTVDAVAGVDLTRYGSPVYSADTNIDDSNLSMVFDGDDWYNVGQNVLPVADNYGFEAWAKADALDGFNFLVSCGTNYGGIALIQQGNKMGILAPGVGWPVPVTYSVPVGEWHHYACVVNAGTVQFYVDGILIDSGSNNAKPVQTSFTIGANDKVNGGSANSGSPTFEGYWKGTIDSVRVFTFGPGLFDVGDLLMIPPSKATTPFPANGATSIQKSDLTLSWTVGYNASGHQVYLGQTEQGVLDATTNSPEFQCTISANSYNTANLAYQTTYYWRIDEIEDTPEGQVIHTGDVWSFTTEAEAITPPPTKSTDLNDDGSVNLEDFAIFCQDWLTVKQTITIETLLDEMVDREAMVRYPDPYYQCKQSSSYNRASVTPDDYNGWFADSDGTQCIRTEQIGGQTEWVLMEHDGPGCVTHAWTPYFYYSLNNHIGPKFKIYLDGATEPVIMEDMIPLFMGQRFILPPYGFETVRAGDLYLPIPFAQSCKITTDQQNFYYIINYRTYPEGTDVETFTMDAYNTAMTNKVENAQLLQNAVTDTTGAQSTMSTTAIAAGGEASLAMPGGSNAIYTLEIDVAEYMTPQVLRSTILQITCDGVQTVWCPLADFFCGVKYRAFEGWYRTAEEDGTMVSRFIMPYQSTAEVKLLNLSSQTVNASMNAYTKPWTWDSQTMYFHAGWRHVYPQETQPLSDFNFVNISGQGVMIGDSLAVGVPIGGWWGEGDEKIYVDGESFPSHFGTGTEDYYGYAGGVVPAVTDFFDEPFIGQIRAECFPGGQNVQYRTRSLDAIPFSSSLSMNMEISRALFGADVDHAVSTTTFWYAKPGSSSNRGASPAEASRTIPLLDLQ